MYNYKWNVDKFEVVEFLRVNQEDEIFFIRSKTEKYGPITYGEERVSTLPKEYSGMKKLGWFNGRD